MELQASWENILAVLSAEENPLTLQGLSERLPLSPSTIHRHLSALVEAGFVTRQGHRKTAAYVLRERLAVSWTGRMPPGQRQEEGWLRMAWTCNGRVDWRFPLITRVPDVQAQVTLQRFFAEALERGLLTPWLLPRLTQRRQEEKTKRSRRDPYWRHLKDSRDNHGLTFAVYGSCATGEARADSDL
ncbi:MAG: IclR helix-turn-helix domain, partial [Thermoplasmata archaeon]|nr:IclR helix-turn-helix domain [Thermoplasmata archaeon]